MCSVHKLNITTMAGWFLGLVIVSHFCSTYNPPSLGLVLNRKFIFSPGTLNLFTIVLAVIWYSVIISIFDANSKSYLLNTFCAIAIMNLVWMAMQANGYDPWFKHVGYERNGATDWVPKVEVVGFCLNPGITAAMLAFCLPAFFRFWWTSFLPFVAVGLLGAESRGGVLAAGVGIGVWYLFEGRWALVVSSAVVAVVILKLLRPTLPIIGSTMQVRFDIWEKSWTSVKEFPILGLGPGQFQTAMHKLYFQDGATANWYNWAHNEFIQPVAEYGVGFLLWVSAYFYKVGKRIRQNCKLSITALAIIVTDSLVSFPFRVACTGMVALTWLAIVHIEQRDAVWGS